jgi:two-component system, OmpR family, KDP operon response regulator KdpE
MRKIRILIVDSDPVTRRFIKSNLESRDYEIALAMDGAEAIQIVKKEIVDISLVNVLLRDISGLEICPKMRELSPTPILMFSSYDKECEIACLNSGADDFLSDPYDIEGLVAHINAVFRRTGRQNNGLKQSGFSIGNLKIEFQERRVVIDGHEIKLTPTEFSLLQELALNPDKVLTHANLLNKVWGPEYGQEKEYLRVFIGRLRKKLESDSNGNDYIETVPWVGYKLGLKKSNQILN